MAISRREILGVLWTGMVAGVMIAFGPVLAGQPRLATTDTRASRLLTVFRRRKSAMIVGRKYLERHPRETDPDLLVKLIAGDPLRPLPTDEDDRRALARWLQLRFREDFIQGLTVRVEGWLLSQTEARLCAMVAMLESAA